MKRQPRVRWPVLLLSWCPETNRSSFFLRPAGEQRRQYELQQREELRLIIYEGISDGWDHRKDDGMLENSDQLVLICSAGIPPPLLHAGMFRKSGSDRLLLHYNQRKSTFPVCFSSDQKPTVVGDGHLLCAAPVLHEVGQ